MRYAESGWIVIPFIQRQPGDRSPADGSMTHSLISVVFPKPAGAEMKVSFAVSPSFSRSIRRDRGTVLARSGGMYNFVAKMVAGMSQVYSERIIEVSLTDKGVENQGEVMENTEMLAIFNKEIRRECERPNKQRQVLPNIVRYTPMDGGSGGSFISWSDLTADSADAAIQGQIDTFRELNADFEWIYYSYDLPTDLPKRLLSLWFHCERALSAHDSEHR